MNLPSGNFKWFKNPNYFMNPKVWKNLTPDDPTGFWLEVTVEVPRKLHSSVAFNTFPPLPETKVLKYSDAYCDNYLLRVCRSPSPKLD